MTVGDGAAPFIQAPITRLHAPSVGATKRLDRKCLVEIDKVCVVHRGVAHDPFRPGARIVPEAHREVAHVLEVAAHQAGRR